MQDDIAVSWYMNVKITAVINLLILILKFAITGKKPLLCGFSTIKYNTICHAHASMYACVYILNTEYVYCQFSTELHGYLL